MKYYQLKKDLPTFKVGDIFELRENGCLYLHDNEDNRHWQPDVMAYHSRTLKNFPNILKDWFEDITGIYPLVQASQLLAQSLGKNYYHFRVMETEVIGKTQRVAGYILVESDSLESATRKADRILSSRNCYIDAEPASRI